MNKTDQRLYERTKDISYEDILYDCDNVSVNNNPFNADELMLKRMKARVMMQIKTTKTKRTLIKNLLAASFVLSFLAAALSPLGRNAFADILNKFYFIPGIGKAVLDDAEEVYILPKPILSKGDYGSINIHTITKTADTMIINVSSDVSLNNKSLLIEANKQEYRSSQSMIGQGEYSTAMYVFKIPTESKKYVIKLFDQYTIPFTLIKAESFDRYEKIGPTNISNNYGLTIIPFRLNNQIQIEILEHSTNKGSVALYGSYNKEMEDNVNIKILDNNAQTYRVERPKSYMGLKSSFTFTPVKDAKSFTVNIPELTLKYEVNSKIKLPMPMEGVTEVNKAVDMQGFIVDINQIVRKNDKVTVYVDTNYKPKHPENICYFTVNMDKMSLDYYHWLMNDQAIIEGFEFYINPKEKNLTIYFNELYTTLKGPWNFLFNNLK